jgi:hypothetical protein
LIIDAVLNPFGLLRLSSWNESANPKVSKFLQFQQQQNQFGGVDGFYGNGSSNVNVNGGGAGSGPLIGVENVELEEWKRVKNGVLVCNWLVGMFP